jgi:hypothetical protein
MFFLTFSIQVIVNTERSRSFYILEWVECAPQEASIEVIENEYKIKYQTEDLKEFKLRLSEHITRGVITIYPKPELTWFGKLLYITSTFLAKVFKLNGWKANKIWSKCD